MIRRHPMLAFVLACLVPVHAILWTALAVGAEPEVLQPLKLLFALLPTTAAVAISWRIGGEDEVANLFGRTWRRGVSWRLHAIATLAFIAIGFAALGLRVVWDGHQPPPGSFASWQSILATSPFLLLFPGIAEEYGWRGFLQERLQTRTSVLAASIAVGLVWGTWHTMDFLMGNWTGEAGLVVFFFLYIVGASTIIGACYAASGSVLVAMLAHFGANAASDFLPIWTQDAGARTPILFVALIWIVGLASQRFVGKPRSTRLPEGSGQREVTTIGRV